MKKTVVIIWILLISALASKIVAQEHDSTLTAAYFQEGKILWLAQPGAWMINNAASSDLKEIQSDSDNWYSADIRMIGNDTPKSWKGIGWFKTALKVDSSMFGQDVAIYGFSRGGAEFYLNDKLLFTDGKVGTDAESEVSGGYIKPFVFKLSSKTKQDFYIRYSNFEIQSKRGETFSGIDLYLGNPNSALQAYENQVAKMDKGENRFYMIFGFMMALAMFHLILFFYYPKEKANLTCALLFISLSGIFLSGILFDWSVSALAETRSEVWESFSLILAGITLPFFIYQILKRKFNWLPFTFLAIGMVLLVTMLFGSSLMRSINFLFFLISMTMGIVFILHGRFILKKTELNIVVVFYFLALILVLPGLLNASFEYLVLWGNEPIFMNLTAPVGAVGYSFYLARGVAVTNRRLNNELIENKRLTTEKIAVEQEKQSLITRQKEQLEKDVKARTFELSSSLKTLKETQNQLIQQEKLASLGELTAGIAHEIQNPLNFVNNFSEVSNELVDEMNEELDKGDIEEAKSISADIKQNLEKINHHGKRADSIVKGMLQHSRTNIGQIEPTDINALCDEFLRLAYHGIRAKDKSFNATLETDFDQSIGKINVISQDIGRVVLNLINNAFYAVAERSRSTDAERSQDKVVERSRDYNPTVSLNTKKADKKIEISVSDNGNGIPQEILDKIFQPFFTTKPTGQGTGLGLSLSYDIVTKGHKGELTVETKEGKGTTFNIQIPI